MGQAKAVGGVINPKNIDLFSIVQGKARIFFVVISKFVLY